MDDIINIYAYAKVHLNMSSAEVDELTPQELRAYFKVYRSKEYNDRAMFALIASVIANVNVNRKSKPKGFSIKDFIGEHPETLINLTKNKGTLCNSILAAVKEYNG